MIATTWRAFWWLGLLCRRGSPSLSGGPPVGFSLFAAGQARNQTIYSKGQCDYEGAASRLCENAKALNNQATGMGKLIKQAIERASQTSFMLHATSNCLGIFMWKA